MRRATSMLRSVAVAVAATGVGCLLVLTLLPSHARPWPTEAKTTGTPGGGPAHADVTGQDGSAAHVAAAGLGAATAERHEHRQAKPAQPKHSHSKRTARNPRIEVTALQPGLSFRGNGSFSVDWKNNTGHEVDVWLTVRTRGHRMQRLGLVAPRAGAGAIGEALVTLPQVAPGRGYALEVAADDDIAHAYSTAFAVTG
ncbi:hypothetical protein ACWC2K_06955 [Streptomyces chattanoogensis]|uniref:hypothetical protein n=1 Tax=Streptomyces chattanoogensis TaxID=66876 RepID=UPI0036C2433A